MRLCTCSAEARITSTIPVMVNVPAHRLGIEIRRHRMRRGVSQEGLVRRIGLAARSNLSDYERGRRIPPLDVVIAIETELLLAPGELVAWHVAALAERASSWHQTALARIGDSEDSTDLADRSQR
jgi:transcriptional regulator with XRE-family HTH domain